MWNWHYLIALVCSIETDKGSRVSLIDCAVPLMKWCKEGLFQFAQKAGGWFEKIQTDKSGDHDRTPCMSSNNNNRKNTKYGELIIWTPNGISFIMLLLGLLGLLTILRLLSIWDYGHKKERVILLSSI